LASRNAPSTRPFFSDTFDPCPTGPPRCPPERSDILLDRRFSRPPPAFGAPSSIGLLPILHLRAVLPSLPGSTARHLLTRSACRVRACINFVYPTPPSPCPAALYLLLTVVIPKRW
jgi:hypothetical protein